MEQKKNGLRPRQRVELVHTDDEYTNLRPGDQGVITAVEQLPESLAGGRQVDVRWDSGSTLAMLVDHGDRIRVVTD